MIVERQLPCRMIGFFDCFSFSVRSAYVISVPSVLEWFCDVVNFVTENGKDQFTKLFMKSETGKHYLVCC